MSKKKLFSREFRTTRGRNPGGPAQGRYTAGSNPATPTSMKPKFKVYGVLEMWDAYRLGKNDGTLKEMEYLLSKKVE